MKRNMTQVLEVDQSVKMIYAYLLTGSLVLAKEPYEWSEGVVLDVSEILEFFVKGLEIELQLDLFPLFLGTLSGFVAMVVLGVIFLFGNSFWIMVPLFFLKISSISWVLFSLSFWYLVEAKWIILFFFLAFQVLWSLNYINNLVSLILLFSVISLSLWIGYLLDFISFILLSLYVGGVLILFLTVIKLLGVEKRDFISFDSISLFVWCGIFVILWISFIDLVDSFFLFYTLGYFPFLSLVVDGFMWTLKDMGIYPI